VDDDDLIVSFEGCRRGPEAFDHRARVRVAWIDLSRRDDVIRGDRMTTTRTRLVEPGAGPKYRTSLEQFAVYDSSTCGSNE